MTLLLWQVSNADTNFVICTRLEQSLHDDLLLDKHFSFETFLHKAANIQHCAVHSYIVERICTNQVV